MLWHQSNPHPFRGTQTHGRGTPAMEKLLVFLLNEIDLDIRTVGIMVVHHQTCDLGIDRQLTDLGNDGMSPAMLMRHVCLEILRVMNQQIRAMAEFDPLIIAGSRPGRRFQFIIRDIDTGHPVLLYTIGISATGMVDRYPPDIEILSGQQHFEVLGDALSPGGQLTRVEWKIRTVNLVKQGADLAVFFHPAGENANTPVRLINRCEKRIALNVVPMTVGQQDIYLIIAVLEPLAELPNACTRVKDEVPAVFQLDINTGSVSAVFCSCRSRGGDRTTDTVEGY